MRIRESFNDKWFFHKGDIKTGRAKDKGPLYMQAKTERYRMGPASVFYSGLPEDFSKEHEYRDVKWEHIRLPHDYVVMGTPDPTENNAMGFLKHENAWYRKKFVIPEEDADKRLVLEFEGVTGKSEIYFNGSILKRNFCGYTSFEVDITDFARFGKENVLAVYVNIEESEGWWYEGGGIYRNVWLLKTDEIAIDTYGVYARPEKISDTDWKVAFETTAVSIARETEKVGFKTEIVDGEGKVVASAEGETEVGSHTTATAKYETVVHSPKLWDIDSPNLYTVKTYAIRNDEVCDEYDTRIGFRYFECNADKGFFLNGRHVKIKGVCGHEDCGLLGKATTPNVHRYKAELLKEMGANGYRTSHYQQNNAMLDAMDELGFIVMNEARWFSSSEESIAELETLIKRDRNRPSVFFWSLSNEEPDHVTEVGRRITKTLMEAVKRLDNTRAILSAVDRQPEIATVFDELDVVGINYNVDCYDMMHQKYPKKAIISSECAATGTTRGWYADDCDARGYHSAYDKDFNYWFKSREYTWKTIDSRNFVMGGYQWTGIEYRGETVWPRLCSQSGAIDLFFQKKDAFYQNKSHWSESPMIHMMPHWNPDVYDEEPVRVRIYTNCEEAELVLNGKSLGRKTVEKHTPVEWQVAYEKGRIEAKGYIGGKVVANDYHETASAPVKLCLRLENKVEKADDVAIVTCYTVDAEGRFVPTASPVVEFHTNSFGKIISTGSDISDHTPLYSPIRKMRAGYVTAAVGVAEFRGAFVGTEGTIEVFAKAEGLAPAKLKIKIGE